VRSSKVAEIIIPIDEPAEIFEVMFREKKTHNLPSLVTYPAG
jgi:hypothetical protein